MSKIRLGVLGGGGDSLIGVLHRVASFMYDRYEIVGGYALQLYWADGHNTGIYSFEYLRGLS